MTVKKKEVKVSKSAIRILSRVINEKNNTVLLHEANEIKNFIKARKGDKSVCIVSQSFMGDTNSAYLYIFDVQPKLVVRLSDHAANLKNIESRTSGKIKAPTEVKEFTDKWSMFHEVLDVTKKIK